MEFGISYLPDGSPETQSPAAYYESALELAAIADRGGLRYAKMTEHYLRAYGGYCPSPLAFLAAVASRTRQIRLMTGCILAAFHHPLQVASETAMIDALSGGRLDVGFARAYMPYEYEALGVPLDESRERYTAVIETVLRLWTESNVSVTHPAFSLHHATILPRVTQRPHPPVWVAAVRSRQSFAWIGEQGFNLLATFLLSDLEAFLEHVAVYREAFEEARGRDGPAPLVAVSQPLYIAEDDRVARREGDHFVKRYFDVWADAATAWDRVGSSDYPGYTGMSWAIRANTPEVLRESGKTVFGEPARVIDRVHWLKETINPDVVLWQVDFGAMPFEPARRTLTLFLDQVLPHL